jgi:hypothetical protein
VDTSLLEQPVSSIQQTDGNKVPTVDVSVFAQPVLIPMISCTLQVKQSDGNTVTFEISGYLKYAE